MQMSRLRFPKSDFSLQLRGSSSVQPSKSPKPFSSHQLRYYCCSISSAQCWIVSSSAQCWIISSAQCWIICHQPKAGLFIISPKAGLLFLISYMLDYLSSAQSWIVYHQPKAGLFIILMSDSPQPLISYHWNSYFVSSYEWLTIATKQLASVFMNGSPQPCISWFVTLWHYYVRELCLYRCENTSPFHGTHCPEIRASDTESVLMKVTWVFILFCSISTVTYCLLFYSLVLKRDWFPAASLHSNFPIAFVTLKLSYFKPNNTSWFQFQTSPYVIMLHVNNMASHASNACSILIPFCPT